jgi:hypothetical protein
MPPIPASFGSSALLSYGLVGRSRIVLPAPPYTSRDLYIFTSSTSFGFGAARTFEYLVVGGLVLVAVVVVAVSELALAQHQLVHYQFLSVVVVRQTQMAVIQDFRILLHLLIQMYGQKVEVVEVERILHNHPQMVVLVVVDMADKILL